MFLFHVLSFFKKGDTIQGGTLFKGGHYLRTYCILNQLIPKKPQMHLKGSLCSEMIVTHCSPARCALCSASAEMLHESS